MASVYTGANGALYLLEPGSAGSGAVNKPINWSDMERAALVTSWDFTTTTDVLDITPLGDTDRTHVDGLRTLTGSMSIIYDYEQNEASKVLNKVIKAREGRGGLAKEQIGGVSEDTNSRFVLRLALSKVTNLDELPDNLNSKVRYMQVRVMFTSVSMSSTVGSISTVEASWQSNGAPETVRW